MMEDHIRAEFNEGRPIEFCGTREERYLDVAWFVRSVLMAPQSGPAVHTRCEIRGATLIGKFDLSGWQKGILLTLRDCIFEETPDFSDCSLDGLRLPGCLTPGLEAAGLRTRGDLDLSDLQCFGQVDLHGARIDGSVSLRGANIRNPGEIALQLSHARVTGQFSSSSVRVDGTIQVIGMRVGGMFSIWHACLRAPLDGISFNGERLDVGETLFMKGDFSSEGVIYLSYARIGGGLDMSRAQLGKAPEKRNSLVAKRIAVGRNISMIRGFQAAGTVCLDRSAVGGDITVTDSKFLGVPVALTIENAVCDRLVLRLPDRPDGEFGLQGAAVGTLVDKSPQMWPRVYDLEGFTFRRMIREATSDYGNTNRARTLELVQWASRAKGGYLPGIYDAIDAALRSSGEEDEALVVRYEKQRAKTRSLGGVSRVWGEFLDWTVGYGFKGLRAFYWLLGLTAMGGMAFLLPPLILTPGENKECYPFAYAADLLLPVIDLGQVSACVAHGSAIWLGWGLIVAGWSLTAAVVAATGRVFRRGG